MCSENERPLLSRMTLSVDRLLYGEYACVASKELPDAG